MSASPISIDVGARVALTCAIGDTPQTVISVHLLRRGLCGVFVDGPVDRPHAVIVQAYALPSEPVGFGDDAHRLWQLLQGVVGWSCVNVAAPVGPALAEVIEATSARRCVCLEDVYLVLDQPPPGEGNAAVRRLTRADLPTLRDATPDFGRVDWGFGSHDALLQDGFAAGALVDGRLVALAFTSARSERHADIGVITLSPWRGRGLSTAAAALVCADVQAAGQRPVWSTGADNMASRRVAAKLGFVEVSRRVYVNVT